MDSQVRVPVASESAYKTNCSLRASVTRFRTPVASGLAPAEPPTMVRPLHRLGLGSLRCRHTAIDTSFTVCAMACVKPPQELPRRIRSSVTSTSL
jgi:hypothetical protein